MRRYTRQRGRTVLTRAHHSKLSHAVKFHFNGISSAQTVQPAMSARAQCCRWAGLVPCTGPRSAGMYRRGDSIHLELSDTTTYADNCRIARPQGGNRL